MGDLERMVSTALDSERETLAEEIAARHYARQSGVWEPFGKPGWAKSVRDAGYHLAYLSEAIAANQPSLFEDYALWAQALFTGLGFRPDTLKITLECTREVLAERLPPAMNAVVQTFLNSALLRLGQPTGIPPTFLDEHAPLSALAQSYLAALLRGDRREASRLVLDAVDQGTPVKDVYLHVFQPVQHEIGRLWQLNRISVAQEHFCTAATQMIMSQLYPRIFATERKGRTLVATCVGGELHEIGARMVADFFEMEGWDTFYLGANTPTPSIVRTLEERQADVLAVSATITYHVSAVAALIADVRASSRGGSVKILVGGYPFNVAPGLYKSVGADGTAPNAQEAVWVAERLVA